MVARIFFAGVCALLVAQAARAFSLIGNSWPDGSIVMQLQLGAAPAPLMDGSADWGAVAESALNEWNAQLARTKFTVVRDSTAAVARGNRTNNVVFRPDVYGQAWGDRVLAVTLGTSSTATFASTEKDVLFNSTLAWDSYRGALRLDVRDLRRVALHEFGHVLGLDHPDQATPVQSVAAVMNSVVSSVETLRPDDIAGAHAIYDAFPNSASPQSRSLAEGSGTFTLNIPISGNGPFTYAWFFRAAGSLLLEPFHLATGSSYAIGSAQTADAGTYIATATRSDGTFFSSAATLSVAAAAPATDTRLANISTRGVVGSGSDVLIAGLVIGGTTAKNILVRAAGPALADFNITGALADPTLSIFSSTNPNQPVATNDNWETQSGGSATALADAAARLGAFPFKAGSRDAALLTTLAPGNYTAIVSGVNGTSGVALVEAYDADPDPATARTRKLLNIATRGQVGTGEDVLIAGLVVTGPGPRTYLIRAVGPTLTKPPFNLSGALLDPFLQIYQGTTLLHENDDWDTPITAQPALRQAAARVGAFALLETRDAATHSGLDAALLITLPPGSYTAKISGFQGVTGVALIEIYEMP